MMPAIINHGFTSRGSIGFARRTHPGRILWRLVAADYFAFLVTKSPAISLYDSVQAIRPVAGKTAIRDSDDDRLYTLTTATWNRTCLLSFPAILTQNKKSSRAILRVSGELFPYCMETNFGK